MFIKQIPEALHAFAQNQWGFLHYDFSAADVGFNF